MNMLVPRVDPDAGHRRSGITGERLAERSYITARISCDRCSTDDSGLDGDAAAFGELRNRLLGIAYRILGSWNQAEDIVQDAWLRWQRCDRTSVVNATAFLVTTTTRLAINAAQSAHARRESCLGPRMPEPVAPADDPALRAEHIDVLERGILLLLERLAPSERAAFVLHEAFDYPYPHIAQVLHTTDVNARQLVSRARKHLTTSRRRPANRDGQRRLLHAFVAAARHGDVADLEHVLAAEAAIPWTDHRPEKIGLTARV
jgi:RNA polymerase sigma-70 factor, ECF subfamily